MTTNKLIVALADDDRDDRELLAEAICDIKVGTELMLFEDGQLLMDSLKGYPELLPDIVFLDINMPIKDGLQCLAEIRNDYRLRDIFVAIYSTSCSERDIEEAFVLGANIYITKPGSFTMLKKAISKVLCSSWQYKTAFLRREHFLLQV